MQADHGSLLGPVTPQVVPRRVVGRGARRAGSLLLEARREGRAAVRRQNCFGEGGHLRYRCALLYDLAPTENSGDRCYRPMHPSLLRVGLQRYGPTGDLPETLPETPGHTCPRLGWPHTPHKYMRRRVMGVKAARSACGTTAGLATRRWAEEARRAETLIRDAKEAGDEKYPSLFFRKISDVSTLAGDDW